ncbi:MAG: PEP-CTERM sorting domain-containing protein [Planctomycetaceae bacterium]
MTLAGLSVPDVFYVKGWCAMRFAVSLLLGTLLGALLTEACDAGVIAEVEANNSLAAAQNIDGNFTLDFRLDIGNGDFVTNTSTTIPHVTILGSGDGTYDYYSFSVAGSLPRYAIFDIDFTTSGFDSHLAIWFEDGTLLGHNDDYDAMGGAGGSISDLDSLHALYLLDEGTYIVGVARASAGPDVGGFTGNAPETGQSYYLHVSVEGQPVVPEPSTLMLLTAGTLLLAGVRARRTW